LQEQAAALQDFLPAGSSTRTLQKGLEELELVLKQPGRQHKFEWLEQHESQQQHLKQQQEQQEQQHQPVPGGLASSDNASGTSAITREQQPPVPAARSSSLSVAAAEFRPAGAGTGAGPAASLAVGLASLQLGSDYATGSGSGDDSYSFVEPSSRDSAGQWSAAAAAAEAQAEAGGGLPQLAAGGAAAEAAFLAVLAEQYPLWSTEALQQLFAEQGGDLAATIHTLCTLEKELEGQQQAGSGSAFDGYSYGSSPQVRTLC